MYLTVPTRISKIFDMLKTCPYKGTLRCQHLSVATINGKIVSPIGYNYFRTYVYGTKRGTIHAEMTNTNFLLNNISRTHHQRTPDFSKGEQSKGVKGL